MICRGSAWEAVGRLYANTELLHRRDLNADFVIHVGSGTNTPGILRDKTGCS